MKRIYTTKMDQIIFIPTFGILWSGKGVMLSVAWLNMGCSILFNEKCMKRLAGALYGIFLEPVLDRICRWKGRIEKDFFRYCMNGCKNCYKWRCAVRSEREGSPYRKFRKKVR